MKHKLYIVLLVVSMYSSMFMSQSYAQNSADVNNLSTNVQGSGVNNNSNNTTNSNSNATTYNGNAPGSTPPPSAIAPSFMAGGTDSCLMGYGGSVTTSIIGISAGSYVRDEQCEMLKLAKTLNDLGLKVAAVATLCQDKRVFSAMAMAGTPCPYLGTIGAQATALWKENPKMRPDYGLFKTLKPIELDKKPDEQVSTNDASLSDRFRYSKRSGVKYESF
jgi:hypothetical protein